MSGTADRGPVNAATRRAWIALTVTGTGLLMAGVLMAAAGEAAAPGTERGIPGAVIAGGVLFGCGLLCGFALLATAIAGLPGARGRTAAPPLGARLRAPGPAGVPRTPGLADDAGRQEAVPGAGAGAPGGAQQAPTAGGAVRGPFEPAVPPAGASGTDGVSTGESAGNETSEEWLRSLRPGGRRD